MNALVTDGDPIVGLVKKKLPAEITANDPQVHSEAHKILKILLNLQ